MRGVVPDDLDEDLARRIGAAFAEWSGGPERGDRPGLPSLVARSRRRARTGITSRGVGVIDLGLASTDLLYFASGSLDLPADHAHREPQPEAVQRAEVLLAGAKPVGEESGLLEIAGADGDRTCRRPVSAAGSSIAICSRLRRARADVPGRLAHATAHRGDRHCQRHGRALSRRRSWSGCPVTLHHLFPELDGTFPNHPADPIDPENQRDLKAAVLQHEADIGLAFDGDADRVFLIDERGQDVSGSIVTALVAKAMLAREPGASIIYNVICSWTVREVIAENGGVPGSHARRSLVHQAGDGGDRRDLRREHSGHYYFRENYRADSGLIAAVDGDWRSSRGERPALRAARAVPTLCGARARSTPR